MSNEKDMQKSEWKDINLRPHLRKAREEQERFNQEKRDKHAAKKDLKFTTAEECMNQDSD